MIELWELIRPRPHWDAMIADCLKTERRMSEYSLQIVSEHQMHVNTLVHIYVCYLFYVHTSHQASQYTLRC